VHRDKTCFNRCKLLISVFLRGGVASVCAPQTATRNSAYNTEYPYRIFLQKTGFFSKLQTLIKNPKPLALNPKLSTSKPKKWRKSGFLEKNPDML
jgi:hypothetical protein